MDVKKETNDCLFIETREGVLTTNKNNAMESADDLSYYYNQLIQKSYTNYDPYSYALENERLG